MVINCLISIKHICLISTSYRMCNILRGFSWSLIDCLNGIIKKNLLIVYIMGPKRNKTQSKCSARLPEWTYTGCNVTASQSWPWSVKHCYDAVLPMSVAVPVPVFTPSTDISVPVHPGCRFHTVKTCKACYRPYVRVKSGWNYFFLQSGMKNIRTKKREVIEILNRVKCLQGWITEVLV